MTPVVLVHGGGLHSRCWDPVLPHLAGPAGFDEIVLVGHSLAGCSIPATIGVLGERVRHTVSVACTVPEDGTSCLDTLDPEVQAVARAGGDTGEPRTMDEAMAKLVLGNDLDEEEFAWCVERFVAEAPRLTSDPVDLSPLRLSLPRTWIRTLQDIIPTPGKQLRFAGNVGNCPMINLDAGHVCMVGKPEATASLLNRIAA